jgi:hypothetical protein
MEFLQVPVIPFTMEKSAIEGAGKVFKIFGIIFVAVLLGFLHKLLLEWFPYANLILIPVYLGAILYFDRVYVYRKITWKEVDQANSYA